MQKVPVAMTCQRSANERRLGFTLVELVIVLLIVAVISAIAVSRVQDYTSKATASSIIKQAQIVEQAAQSFKASEGRYPGDARPGVFPAEFDGYLNPNFFSQEAPGGGQWDWNGDSGFGGVHAGVSIRNRSAPMDLWLQVDRLVDDGDLTTGYVKMFRSNHLQFELQAE